MTAKSESAGLAVSTVPPQIPSCCCSSSPHSSSWLTDQNKLLLSSWRAPTAAAAYCCKTHLARTSTGSHHHDDHHWPVMSKSKNAADGRAAPVASMEGAAAGGGGSEEHQLHRAERARCEWDFRLCSVISPDGGREASDALGAIEFDPSDQLVATGGIARKIRIYALASLLQAGDAAACSYYICTPAKLSSLRWRPDSGGRLIGAGDYDGVVTEYDLERRLAVFERDEHDGRRVWSVDYSRWTPQLGASGSDDGAARLWDSRCGRDVASLCPHAAEPGRRPPVCCVEFDSSSSGGGGSLVGLGCADRRAYVYDLRMAASGLPVTVFGGHRRTVTYLRFVGGGRVVTAGTDGRLRLWDVAEGREAREYEGHANERSFVGLSVWRAGGLLACGSETRELFVYDIRWGEPIWVGGFEAAAEEEGGRGFVSSVCWRQTSGEEEDGGGGDACTVVAGASNGVLQVFAGRRRKPAGGAQYN